MAGEWVTMLERFEALGQAADVALDADLASVAALLAERDALLDQLTLALAAPAAVGDGQRADASAAVDRATVSTATLIAKVAERTDALRRALRDLDRGARATHAYQTPPGTRVVDARR